jgi:hypothetical protein
MRGAAAAPAADLKKVVKAVEATGKSADFIATSLSLWLVVAPRYPVNSILEGAREGPVIFRCAQCLSGNSGLPLLLRVSVLQGRGRASGFLCIRDEAVGP